MSNLRNRVQLIGHLGANPEIKNFESGNKSVTMTIATSERYQSNGEWKEETQWHRLVAWNKIAEMAERQLRKGNFILVEGKLTHRSYDGVSGEKKYITEVQVKNFVLLDKNISGASEGSVFGSGVSEHTEEESGLPF